MQNYRNMVAKCGEMLYITHVGHFPDVIRLERYRRGHNEPHSKCGRQETGARVRIPFSPPTKRTNTPVCPFCFRYLIKGIRTRALRKRHSASFLAADRGLLQSIKIANQGCFAKGKNESLSYALNRDSARCVASCRLRREPLRRKANHKRRENKRLHLRKSSAADIANDCAICRTNA